MPTRVKGKPRIDLADQDINDWHVIEFVGIIRGQSMWLCRCKCGKVKRVTTGNLRSGRSPRCMSCGGKGKHTTHGMSGTWTQRTHASLKNTKKLAPEWQKFKDFYAAVGKRPTGTTLIRTDARKPYGPGNGQWGVKAVLSDQQVALLRNTTGVDRCCLVAALKQDGFTYKDMADAMGITRQRVRQLGSPKMFAKGIETAKRRIAHHQGLVELWRGRLEKLTGQRPPATIDQAAVDAIEREAWGEEGEEN